MKFHIIIILSIFACVKSSFSQVSKDSLKYCKTGTFRYVGMYSDEEIKRTKSTQLEYNHDKSSVIKMKVKWVSDDEYWLIFVSCKNEPDVQAHSKKGDILKVKITRADRKGYDCHYSQDGHEGECSFTREL